jgi:hypothetical protein
LWEAAQLPLYTIWWTGTRREILFAVVHCTGGDLLISAAALALAALATLTDHWPLFGVRMALTAIGLGHGYTVLSEWLTRKSAKAGPTPRRCPFFRHPALASPPSCMADRAGDRVGLRRAQRHALRGRSPMTEIYAMQPVGVPGMTAVSCLMRSLLFRCLVLVLSLALVSGNAHAALHLGGAHTEPCPEEHAHHTGTTSPDHQHQHDHGIACCCDCLGCTSAAYLSPQLATARAEIGAQINYDLQTAPLAGLTLLPEPGPPRPGTLS